MLGTLRLRGAVIRRHLGFVAAVAVLSSADVAFGCSLPRRVVFRSSIEIDGGGVLELRGVCQENGARFAARAHGLPDPEFGDYGVVLGSTAFEEEIDLGFLEAKPDGKWALTYNTDEDIREFALAVDTLTLLDGEFEVTSGDILAGCTLNLATRAYVENDHHGAAFELAGRIIRRTDGTASFEFRGKARGAAPGTYVLRLQGGDGVPFDLPLEVQGRTARAKLTGDDDLLFDAMNWDEFVVSFEDQEIGRGDISCR